MLLSSARSSRSFVRSPFRAFALLSVLLAAAIAGSEAHAYGVAFDVIHTTVSGTSCFRFTCSPIVPGPPLTGSFVLDSSALAAGGDFDVSASYQSPLLSQPLQPGTVPAFSAVATVAGGIVTGLAVSYSWSEPIVVIGGTRSYSFSSGIGTWSDVSSAFPSSPFPSSSFSRQGTYVITPHGIPGPYPIPFELTCVITGGQTCSRFGCFPVVPGAPIAGTFTLDSTLLATPGAHDITATLSHPLLRSPLLQTTVPGYTASATVGGGLVTNVQVSWSWSESIPFLGGSRSYSFNLSGGAWSSFESTSPSPPLPTTTTSMQGTCSVVAGPDGDFDGLLDRLDDCPYAWDPGQEDRGGIGSASTPDGVGDACQCGDVNGDGFVTLGDAVIITRAQLVPPTATLAKPERCDVGGATGCSLADAVIIRRALLVPPSATIQQVCPATLAP